MQNGFQNELQNNKNVAKGSSDSINSYIRLMINLLKIYKIEDEPKQMDFEPIDCVWRVYCEELNRLAPMEDMAGTVARINR